MTTKTSKGKSSPRKQAEARNRTAILSTFLDPVRGDFDNAWLGLEPTFQSKKSVEKWMTMAGDKEGEDAYFEDPYMLGTLEKVAVDFVKMWRKARAHYDPTCLFDSVERIKDLDKWKSKRQNLKFKWADKTLDDFEVRWTLDPETFEYSIKPVPLAWFYDPWFVAFLETFVWGAPIAAGLQPSLAHGGGQFSISAKTVLEGSLLADIIADRLNHPALATWVMDWPNPDARSFRATPERFAAFSRTLEEYWAGSYHPRARGCELTPLDVYLDRGFNPAPGRRGLMDASKGPVGSRREHFQTNFAFGRAVRLRAQNVQPGYWQSAHYDVLGYRPDQVMRYSEGNLNRLQIAGEFHVKSGEVLDRERVPDANAPLDPSMLYAEASWENRGQMGRTSARDYVEAILLDIHATRRLAANPRVRTIGAGGLLQDQMLLGAEATIKKYGGTAALDKLRRKAVRSNLDSSNNRLRSDWIEPEELFWTAWKALPAAEKSAISAEVVQSFVAYVEDASAFDPRTRDDDPMEWHRHRFHPEIWKALRLKKNHLAANPVVMRELNAYEANRETYQSRRPIFSPADIPKPW
ncbi:MAG TPA: hypothetical protein VNM92_17000 [Thermoanaerobaculia bacterium]|nr:hypothetical protein [Thermoanaerobaculia bacterium]